MKTNTINKVLVTGGAGYVGSALVPKLLCEGYKVRVLDLYIYGERALDQCAANPNLQQIKGDIRDKNVLSEAIDGCDAVIHLACISNDPSFELDPELGRSINYEAFISLVLESKKKDVKRFVYASSSSVYGIKNEENVTEDLPLEPLTDYSRYKAACEKILLDAQTEDFCTVIVRPATVCGYSPRLRLDLTVNILTNHAINNKKIIVFGGQQKRPNIHIDDMTDLYVSMLRYPDHVINGQIFNAGYENHKVCELAEMVKRTLSDDIEIVTAPTDDNRSYHISSEKIKKELNFEPKRTIQDAVRDLQSAFLEGKVPDSMTSSIYYNVKRMKELNLK